MINNDRVEFCIDAEEYKQIMSNILIQAPFEIGVEVAVYMLLYGILDNTNYNVIDVSKFNKEQSLILFKEETRNVIRIADKSTDLAIVEKNFKFNKGKFCTNNEFGAYCFVEVKNLATDIDKEEVKVQENSTDHYIWTNGLKWVYRCKNEKVRDIANLGYYKDECTITYKRGYAKEFSKLLDELSSIFENIDKE